VSASVTLSPTAKRDLRRIGPGRDAERIGAALRALGAGQEDLDIKALTSLPGWLQLRVGDWRVIYRAHEGGWIVARIVNRRDLMAAVRTLP